MEIKISNEELLECLSEEIKDYLYEAFSQWVDVAEQCVVDNIYKPITDKIIEKFENNKEFEKTIIDNIVRKIDIDTDAVYKKAEEKAINIIAKNIVLKSRGI